MTSDNWDGGVHHDRYFPPEDHEEPAPRIGADPWEIIEEPLGGGAVIRDSNGLEVCRTLGLESARALLADHNRLAALEDAATALLDNSEVPPSWLAPWRRQLSAALAGEPTNTEEPAGTVATCEGCGEESRIDGTDTDVTTTWQQWECPHCTAWNDKPEEA